MIFHALVNCCTWITKYRLDGTPIRKKSGDNPRCFGRIFLIRGNIPTINGDLTLQSKLEIRKRGDFQFTSRIQKFQSQISHDPL